MNDHTDPAFDTLITNARIVTVAGGPRRGNDMRDLEVIDRGYVALRDDRIEIVEQGAPADTSDARRVIDAQGRVLLPGFVDPHTHACWAGDRLDEFELKQQGVDYLTILKRGGGIMSTVRATRAASTEELTTLTIRHLVRMLRLGTTTAEVKTGYGLTPDAELKMLDAIVAAEHALPINVVPTFLGAHAIDPDNAHFIDETIETTLPAIVDRYPGITCDAYCEDGAWSLEQTRRLFERAQSLGCPLRIHTDQFNSLGATRMALDMGAVSVDHLEATTEADIEAIGDSDTVAVALPISGFQVDDRYAPGRRLIDANAMLAIASNYNPGSAPSPSMPFAISLACRKLGLLPAEAIVAATINAARVLRLDHEVGSIEPGKRADLVIWNETDERNLAYEFATIGPAMVFVAGQEV